MYLATRLARKQHLPIVPAGDVGGGPKLLRVATFRELDIQILPIMEQPCRRLSARGLGDSRAPAGQCQRLGGIDFRRVALERSLEENGTRNIEAPSPYRDLTCSRYCFRPAAM